MPEFTLEIQTIDGIADSDYLDRLAALVYGQDGLIDPLLGLNDDGSVSASFSVVADTAPEAAQRGVALFADSIVAAQPQRLTSAAEIEHGEAAVGEFTIKPASEREPVPA